MKTKEHITTPFIVVDFETGGLDLIKNPISEIGLICFDGKTLKELFRYESLIKPYGKDKYQYDPVAIKITGLDPELLESEGVEIEKVADDVLTLVKGLGRSKQHKPVIVAQNAMMEVKCFQHLFDVTKKTKEFSQLFSGSEDYYGNFIPSYVDTLPLAKWMFAQDERMISFNLESIIERSGLSMSDGHRAMNDVSPSYDFVKLAINKLRSNVIEDPENKDQSSFRDNFKFQY